jgi:NAD(P)H-nitrite reductase large subunit
MRPKVKLAQEAGIKVGNAGGIRVDSHLQSSLSGIYACGDCVEANDILTGEPYLNLFWHNANCQGSVVARNCTGFTTEYPGSRNILNMDVFGNHLVGFGYTESALQKFRHTKAANGQPTELSIIEGEQNGGYYRLVLLGDRCIGGQFINIKKDLGLLWALMYRRKSIKELLRVFEKEEVMCRRPYLFRLRPFFV